MVRYACFSAAAPVGVLPGRAACRGVLAGRAACAAGAPLSVPEQKGAGKKRPEGDGDDPPSGLPPVHPRRGRQTSVSGVRTHMGTAFRRCGEVSVWHARGRAASRGAGADFYPVWDGGVPQFCIGLRYFEEEECAWQTTHPTTACTSGSQTRVLRTDFNEDFSTIDAALGKTERSARRAAAGLERQGSDLYNLLLQNDYEGKTTGWKRALVFDGFQDGAGIAQKDEALILGRNCLSSTGPA